MRMSRRLAVDDEAATGWSTGREGDEIIVIVIGDPLYSGTEFSGEQVALRTYDSNKIN